MLVHWTKKLLVRFTSVRSDISYFHNANNVDPDQAAMPDLCLLFLQRVIGLSREYNDI